MSREVRRHLAGTRAQFEEARDKFPDARMIVGADVYLDGNGTLLLVVPEEWADYLHGKRSEMPEEPLTDGQPFEFNEDEFRSLLLGST